MNILIIIALIYWNLLQLNNKIKKTKSNYYYIALFIIHFVGFISYYYMNADISRDSILFHLDIDFIGKLTVYAKRYQNSTLNNFKKWVRIFEYVYGTLCFGLRILYAKKRIEISTVLFDSWSTIC